MRRVLLLAIAVAVLALVNAQQEKCNGQSCTSSGACAGESGSVNCRCTLFSCRWIEGGGCGGGCVTDKQCQDWAAGDPTCVCSWGQCIRQSDLEHRGYLAFRYAVAAAEQKARQELKRKETN